MGDREPELRRALHSLAASDYEHVEAVLVVQADDEQEDRWMRVQAICRDFARLKPKLLRNPVKIDRRAQNLNLGWEAASGRYIGFLDDDDTVSPRHVSELLAAIKRESRVWAYGRARLCREDEQLRLLSTSEPFRHGEFSLSALWEENFIPIHSFLIDRDGLHEHLRRTPFCEQLTRSEDWDFLLRLAFHHEPARVDLVTCDYYISSTQRNSNTSFAPQGSGPEHNQSQWRLSKQLVDERKAALASLHWWARPIFHEAGISRATSSERGPAVPAPVLRRAIRYLIRRLERLL